MEMNVIRSDVPLALVARKVMFDVPFVVGVPVIAPVVAFRERPAGRVPEATE
jgi:hypothetical protein